MPAYPLPVARQALFAALGAMFLSALPAAHPGYAADVAFAGTWGQDAAHCKLAQDAEGAPFVFSKSGYDQHEAHCTFKSVTASGGVFNIAAECSVEGDSQPQDFTLTVASDTMAWSDATGTFDLIRCK